MYIRPSHRIVDKLIEFTCNQANENDHDHEFQAREVPPLLRLTKCNLAVLTLHRSLFLENIDIIRDIARDCVKIYSRIDEEAPRDIFRESTSNLPHLSAYLEKLLNKSQHAKAYINTIFKQVIGFITSQNRKSFPDNINYLLSFINELRAAHSTSTHEDKKSTKFPENSNADVFERSNSMRATYHSLTKDASLFLYWAAIVVSRYCVDEVNISKDINVNDFMTILDSELSNPGKYSERYLRQFFVIFIQSLERSLGHDLETTLRRCSFVSSVSSRAHIPYNLMLHNWVAGNRERIADFSLKVGDPASCWRNMDIRLSDDLAFKRKSFTSMRTEVSFERALNSMSSSNWRKNITLISEAAIQLNDPDLLYGIESLANDSGLICEFSPLGPMISNLEGNFERTHMDHVDKCGDLEQQSLNEFLKACVEMNLLKENAANVDLLQSEWLKDSYKKLIDPLDKTQSTLDTRLQEVERWLSTWLDSPEPLNIDLNMSAYIKSVSKLPQELLPASHDKAQWFLSQDFIAQTLFSPSQVNTNFKIYSILFEMLKLEDEDKHLPTHLIKINSKNSRWNSVLFRHIRDLNWLDLLRRRDDLIDQVQYRAIKYHRACKNNSTVVQLSEDLLNRSSSCKSKIHCSLLTVDESQSDSSKFKDILSDIEVSTLRDVDKNDLKSKVLRKYLRCHDRKIVDTLILNASYDAGELKLGTTDHLSDLNWQNILNASSDLSKMKSLSIISRIHHDRDELSSNRSSAFKIDVELLKQLNQYKSAKYQSLAVECALRLLKCICEIPTTLDQEALQSFVCPDFQKRTIQTWILIKNNLISLILVDKGNLPILWRKALTELLKVMVGEHPHVLLYSILVYRLESKFEHPSPEPRCEPQKYVAAWLDGCGDQPTVDPKPVSSVPRAEQYDLWQELYAFLTTKVNDSSDHWLETIQETEGFVREIRRISHLCGENLYNLASSVSRRLTRLVCRMQEQITSNGGNFSSESARMECEARFISLCEHAIRQIDVLLLFSEGPNSDTYGKWFSSKFVGEMRALKTLLQVPAYLTPFESPEKSLSELKKFVADVSYMFESCQLEIGSYSSHLWMHLISPRLSRLDSSKIPMPGYCSDLSIPNKQTVTIHKVSQTVEQIVSKTYPKRLVLVGSDGISRSFLLKAQEDVRQDQYLMDLFVVINKLLSGQKETQDICRLRNYSITPISSKSGLIEWVSGSELFDIYKSWLASPSGRLVIEELYSSTCRVVCGTAEVGAPKSNHVNCQVPHDIHEHNTLDVFYQLLWAKVKQADSQSELIKERPSRDNILRYRAEFDPIFFQGVIEQLTDQVPSNLISNSLWHRSINSYSYWRKTKQFTQSCATISMVGYILGLGDRHLGNILLDHDTGEAIHIDFNLWFELGKKMTTPEQVPFRLTHNLIRAFGFAGLEGGFKRTSRKVLNLLREHKSSLLPLLDPINWSFMIVSPNQGETFAPNDIPTTNDFIAANNMTADEVAEVHTSLVSGADSVSPIDIHELGGCMREGGHYLPSDSQAETPKSQPEDEDSVAAAVAAAEEVVSESTTPSEPIGGHRDHAWLFRDGNYQKLQLGSVDYDEDGRPFLNDLQLNMGTSLKFIEGTANKMFERVTDKLSGRDEQLDQIIAGRRFLCSAAKSGIHQSGSDDDKQSDLIQLDDSAQSTNDQVDALIIEASSLKNRAAMYEGWTAWV